MAKGRLAGVNPLEQFGRLAPAQKVLVGFGVLILGLVAKVVAVVVEVPGLIPDLPCYHVGFIF